ncbi:hypothetical protein ACHAWF_018266 [Thalassiosira exigua]
MSSSAKKPPPDGAAASSTRTQWPDAAPLDGEELVFSISCGNSHLHWATHYGDDEEYNPQIFWRQRMKAPGKAKDRKQTARLSAGGRFTTRKEGADGECNEQVRAIH